MRPIAALACLFGVALGSCDQGSVTDTYEVAGRVVDAVTGQGIGSARVTFTSDTLYGASTTTSSNGAYQMAVESDTPFGQVRAERAGYASQESTVYFDTRTRRLDLSLRPAP